MKNTGELPANYVQVIIKSIDFISLMREILHKPYSESLAILSRTNNFFGITQEEFRKLIKKERPNAKFDISTIHRYKGKEADMVIIVNATDRHHPLIHPDSSRQQILGWTRDKIELDERRLFYVAVTRAKEYATILTEEGRESKFIVDLYKKGSDRDS